MEFYKYQGTGNDFVMIDNRVQKFPKNRELIAQMCDRRFGVGADGLILLEEDDAADFRMVYYNSDGNESTMCGNGGRCIVRFAHDLGVIGAQTTFVAVDGLHFAEVDGEHIRLQMIDVERVEVAADGSVFLNSGSPHHIEFVQSVDDFPIVDFGRKVRYSERYAPDGTNVNVVALKGGVATLRTYERGVEDETLSCGTGATATAIALHHTGRIDISEVQVLVQGGVLKVSFEEYNGRYTQVFLEGKAVCVFKGEWR